MRDVHKKRRDWKRRISQELAEYGLNVAFLALVFGAFTTYRRLLLAAYGVSYTQYGFALVQALILGKVISIGSLFRLGRGLEEKPLIYSAVYKTVVFCIFVAIFKVIEHGIKGLWNGEGFTGGLLELSEKDFHELLANSLVVFVALIPFFAVKELGRVLGKEKMKAVGSTGQGNILLMLALGVGNGANGTAWTVGSSEEGIMAAMERRSIAH
jgi:hypothetical protein